MKSIIILISFCLTSLFVSAQAPIRPEPIPISKDSAQRFKTAQEALGIPLTDSIISGTVSLIAKNSNDSEKWKPAKGMADPIIQQFIQQSHYRDRLVFSDFVVIEEGKQKKIDKLTYVFKL